MIDRHGDLGIVFAEGIVGKLRKVNDRVKSTQIRDRQFADILGDDHRTRQAIVEQPAAPVESGVESDRIVAPGQKLRSEHGADIAIGSCKQHSHGWFPWKF